MTKILYFTDDFSDANVKMAKDNGLTIRNIKAYDEKDFVEDCDAVCGDVPDAYKDKPVHDIDADADADADTKPIDKMNMTELKEYIKLNGGVFDSKADKPELLAIAKDIETTLEAK